MIFPNGKKRRYALASVILISLLLTLFATNFFERIRKDSALEKEQKDLTPFLTFSPSDAVGWERTWTTNGHEKKLEVLKRGNDWHIVYPSKIVGDQAEIEANIKNYFSLSPKKKLGSENKHFQLAFAKKTSPSKMTSEQGAEIHTVFYRQEKGNEAWQIRIGNELKIADAYYVEVADTVYLVDRWQILAIRKSLGDLIEKDFLSIDPNQIIKVRGKNFEIERDPYFNYSLHLWDDANNPLEKKNGKMSNDQQEKIDRLFQAIAYVESKKALVEESEKQAVFIEENFLQKFDVTYLQQSTNKKTSPRSEMNVSLAVYFIETDSELMGYIRLESANEKKQNNPPSQPPANDSRPAKTSLPNYNHFAIDEKWLQAFSFGLGDTPF